MTIRLRTLVWLALALATLGGAAGFAFVSLGVYDISATDNHTRPVYHLMDYAMRRSIQARVRSLEVPELGAADRIGRGAGHFREHCVQCHGAPGIAPEPFALGLTPAPANLVGTARAWAPAELFWAVKNGIKMTGMPAWTGRLTDDEIWDVVAFVEASAAMTTQQYAALAEGPRAAQHGHAREEIARPADAKAGRIAAERYLCATCHVIPGIVGADRHVGPPLSGMGARAYIGGLLPNTPENMVRWLKDPRAVDPRSTMPALHLTDQDARDIAAFLATLDDVNR